MIYCFEFLDEYSLGILDVTESDGTLPEVPFCYLRVKNAVHEVAYALLGVIGQRAGGSLYCIGHHQDGLFTGKGVWTRISEQ